MTACPRAPFTPPISRNVRWWWIRHAPVESGARFPASDAAPDLAAAGAGIAALARVLPQGALWLTSPLVRAESTARALIARTGTETEPIALAELAEQDFGAWTGRTYDEVYAETGPWTTPAELRPPGGESFSGLAARVAAALEGLDLAALAGGHAPRDVIAVAHLGTVRAALAHALDLAPASALHFAIEPLSLTRIDRIDSGNWVVRAINRLPGRD